MNLTIDQVYLPGEYEKIKKTIINPTAEKYYATGTPPYMQYEIQQYHKDGTLM
jgi:hypothetical protein